MSKKKNLQEIKERYSPPKKLTINDRIKQVEEESQQTKEKMQGLLVRLMEYEKGRPVGAPRLQELRAFDYANFQARDTALAHVADILSEVNAIFTTLDFVDSPRWKSILKKRRARLDEIVHDAKVAWGDLENDLKVASERFAVPREGETDQQLKAIFLPLISDIHDAVDKALETPGDGGAALRQLEGKIGHNGRISRSAFEKQVANVYTPKGRDSEATAYIGNRMLELEEQLSRATKKRITNQMLSEALYNELLDLETLGTLDQQQSAALEWFKDKRENWTMTKIANRCGEYKNKYA